MMFCICVQAAFEVYGADFMITEDMRPWLLEINSSPSMSRKTAVTHTLVENLQEDTLKGTDILCYFQRCSFNFNYKSVSGIS